jgi:hypothetical protein
MTLFSGMRQIKRKAEEKQNKYSTRHWSHLKNGVKEII